MMYRLAEWVKQPPQTDKRARFARGHRVAPRNKKGDLRCYARPNGLSNADASVPTRDAKRPAMRPFRTYR
jgi:hypothetical protein